MPVHNLTAADPLTEFIDGTNLDPEKAMQEIQERELKALVREKEGYEHRVAQEEAQPEPNPDVIKEYRGLIEACKKQLSLLGVDEVKEPRKKTAK